MNLSLPQGQVVESRDLATADQTSQSSNAWVRPLAMLALLTTMVAFMLEK
jgi:hypothetical protein